MKKWYLWLVLSLVFAVGGIVNYYDGRNITASIIQVSITIALAIIQLICDKHGEKGKKIFNYIGIGLTILLIIWMLFMIVSMFV